MIACYAWTDSVLATYSTDQMLKTLLISENTLYFSTVPLDGTQGEDFLAKITTKLSRLRMALQTHESSIYADVFSYA